MALSGRAKLTGYEFYKKTLGSPRHVVAPMVEQSDHAWRILSRRYNADLCFTPMFHARQFGDPVFGYKYRNEHWRSDDNDRPLIVQFCANDPNTLFLAAKEIQDSCDAVDLNLGCPQYIAKRGYYGSFLQDDWDLIHRMISRLDRELAVPVTAKIRVFDNEERTVEYAKMIEAAGAQMLTVHGRSREQRGHLTGLADWDKIKRVKEAVTIPVIANGNILYHEDIQRCLDYTRADGVMSAEGCLYNPALFQSCPIPPLTWEMAIEYMGICRDICPTRPAVIKSHLFKLFHPCLPLYTDLRSELANAFTFDRLWQVTMQIKERLEEDRSRHGHEEELQPQHGLRTYPHWRCQPHIRSSK